MKQQLNEIKRMQRIAGLITESEYQKSQLNKNITSENKNDYSKALDLIGDELKKVQGNEELMDNSSDMHDMIDSLMSYVRKGKIDKKEVEDAWNEYNSENGDYKPLAKLILKSML
jgi:hypothetical protein